MKEEYKKRLLRLLEAILVILIKKVIKLLGKCKGGKKRKGLK